MADLKDNPSLDGLKTIEKLATDLASCRDKETAAMSKEPTVTLPKLEKLVLPGLDWQLAYSKRENQRVEAQTARRDCEAKAVIDAQSELGRKVVDRAAKAGDVDAMKAVIDFKASSKVIDVVYGHERYGAKPKP